jgi:Fe-Mn family superoxide dismutase
MEHKLPELPYKKDALKPCISEETLEFHYGKHHAAYVANLNKLIKGTEFENMDLDNIIRKSSGSLYNNAAQHWNHSFYWKSLRPELSAPDASFMPAIESNFGSLDQFKEKFTTAAVSLFGSGWVWLIDKGNDALEITTTSNAGNPLTNGKKPLLVCDVWEHAYYIDYRNRRADYIASFWKIVNWEFAVKNHLAK